MNKKVLIPIVGIATLFLLFFTLSDQDKSSLEQSIKSENFAKKEVKKESVAIEYEKSEPKSRAVNTHITLPPPPKIANKEKLTKTEIAQIRAKRAYEQRSYYEAKRRAYIEARTAYYKRARELSERRAKRERKGFIEVGKNGMMTKEKRAMIAHKRFIEEQKRRMLMAQRAKIRYQKSKAKKEEL